MTSPIPMVPETEDGRSVADVLLTVEAAREPSRDLFEAAYTALNGRSWAAAVYDHGSLGPHPDYDKGRAADRFGELIRVAAWFDAALMLVAPGQKWIVDSHHSIATIYEYWLPSHAEDQGFETWQGEGNVPALALCAAALRATASRTQDTEGTGA